MLIVNYVEQSSCLFSSWCWTWATGFGNFMSRCVYIVPLLRILLFHIFILMAIVSQILYRFHKPGKWIFILHDDMFKFYSQSVRMSWPFSYHGREFLIFSNKFCVPCISFSFSILFFFFSLDGFVWFISSRTAGEWTIYPWIHSNCNSLSDSDQLRSVSVPDIHPARYWCCYLGSFLWSNATEVSFVGIISVL